MARQSSGLRSMSAWPLWTLRDSAHSALSDVTKTDLLVIVSMLMLNVEAAPLGVELEEDKQPTPGEFTIPEIACQMGLSALTVERSLRKMRSDEHRLLEEVRFGGKPPWRRLVLPLPNQPPPVNRIDIAPLKWIGEADISITAKSVMLMLWLYRHSHITRLADKAELVNPRVRTLARAARCDRRSLFDNVKHRSGYRLGALSELEAVGWVTNEDGEPGRAIKRYIRLSPPHHVEETDVSKILLDLYDKHRRERREKPIGRVQAVLQQLEDMNFWFDSMTYDPREYAQWAFRHLTPAKPDGAVGWFDLISESAREKYRQHMQRAEAEVIPFEGARKAAQRPKDERDA